MKTCVLLALVMTRISGFQRQQFWKSSRRSLFVGCSSLEASRRRIAIIGGGLAGLSTVYHLLEKGTGLDITVLDPAPVGTGGASAVAGGLLHPLSPRGKLVHWGLEGLNETNKLVQAACKYANHVVLRDEIYRLALDENHAAQLQQSAKDLPSIAEWLSADELKARMSLSRTSAIGALRLHNTCQVIHLPSYLEGLWTACVNRSSTRDSKVRWSIEDITSNVVEAGRLKPFDCVVLTAGSGMFGSNSLVDQKTLPVQLVRGQSVELEFSGHSREWSQTLLCGKYISPLPQHGRVLVGATHEYKSVPLSTDAVVAELRDRSYAMAPEIWDHSVPSKLTGGVRVQSERGKYGRRPMMGRLHDSPIHPNTWLFTGLSSRGLLYHGIYGDILVESILSDHEEAILAKDPGLLWWK